MTLTLQQRRWLLGSALVLTLAAVFAVPQEEEPVAYKATRKFAKAAQSGLSDGATLLRQSILPEIGEQRKQALATDLVQSHPDLLARHAWYVPPVAKLVVAALVEKPVAPPAPFQYMGKLEDSPQGTLIFLSTGSAMGKVQSVIVGQLINSAWRLDSEDASALYLTYIPLGTTQVLSKTAKRAASISPQADQSQAMPDGT